MSLPMMRVTIEFSIEDEVTQSKDTLRNEKISRLYPLKDGVGGTYLQVFDLCGTAYNEFLHELEIIIKNMERNK